MTEPLVAEDPEGGAFVPPPSAAEIKATKPELNALARVLVANGWTFEGIEESLLTEPRHAHLRYHRCRRPELYKVFEKPPKETSTRSSSRNADGYATGDKGQILVNNSGNIREALRRLRVTLRHNDFANVNEVQGIPGFNGELTDAGADRLRYWIEEAQGFLPSVDAFEHILSDEAFQHRYHPVHDYLDALQWDGQARLDTWLIDVAGAEDTAFNRAISRIVLIAAVRRVRQPGCKFDTVIVFESGQGRNKSSAAAILAVHPAWFTDNLPIGAESKQVIEQISGKWICEFAELKGLKGRRGDHVKSFLSRQIDRARPAYGRRTETVPRQFICIGSVNPDGSGYLWDDENRRWWPVKIIRFDLDKLREIRDQLWAEASHYEALDESITLAEELWPEAAEVQKARCEENPYTDVIYAVVSECEGWIKIWDHLDIPVEKRVGQIAQQVGAAMKELGFTRKQVGGRRDVRGPRGSWYYVRGAEHLELMKQPRGTNNVKGPCNEDHAAPEGNVFHLKKATEPNKRRV
jgi:Virulence-associated protein E